MGNVMRRTSSVLSISRPGSVSSDRDADGASLSGSTKDSAKGRDASTISSPPPPPPPVVSNPSPIAESPLREAAALAQETVGPSPLAQPIPSSEVVPPTHLPSVEEAQNPTGYIPPPVIDPAVGSPGAFTDTVAPVEEIHPPPVVDSTVGNSGASTNMADELPRSDIAQHPAVVPIEKKQNSLEYIPPPPVVDSTADELGASTDRAGLPQPDKTRDPHAVDPVEPHVEPATEPAESDPLITEALVDEPASYFDEPMTESIKDIEPARHIDNKTEFSEAVRENADAIFPESHQEAAEHLDVISTTVEAVHKDDTVFFAEPNLGQREEPEAIDHDDFIPVTTEREETQQKTETPILVPEAVRNYDMPSYSMNLGSGQEVWGGEQDYDRERIDKTPASSIKFVDLSFLYCFLDD